MAKLMPCVCLGLSSGEHINCALPASFLRVSVYGARMSEPSCLSALMQLVSGPEELVILFSLSQHDGTATMFSFLIPFYFHGTMDAIRSLKLRLHTFQ